MTKIVLLDGYTMNPGDLSYDSLKALGEVVIFERTPSNKTIERACDAEVILTNKTLITREVIMALPKLKYIGVLATGYNVVDISAAKERGIIVTNVPAYSTDSVAQLAFSLLLGLLNQVEAHSRSVHNGDWCNAKDFSYTLTSLTELNSMTLGIVGYGQIGKKMAQIANAFGMKILANTRSKQENIPCYVDFVSLEELLKNADVITLHCPLTPQSEKLINAQSIALMKPSAIIVNTGRGPLIDEDALAEALNSGRVAGAALDVLSTEPPRSDNPLLTAKNCLITPHIAWATLAARRRLLSTAVSNIKAFLDKTPKNVVS